MTDFTCFIETNVLFIVVYCICYMYVSNGELLWYELKIGNCENMVYKFFGRFSNEQHNGI